MVQQNFSQLAPLTNILMDLSVHELEETLLTVTQWELSGKDIFDLDFDIIDPIEVYFTLFESEYKKK